MATEDPLTDPQQELLREGGVHELELPFNRVGLLGRKLETGKSAKLEKGSEIYLDRVYFRP